MKSEKVSLQIRIDESIYKPLKAIAKNEMRSFNAQLEYFLRESIQEYSKTYPFVVNGIDIGEEDDDE